MEKLHVHYDQSGGKPFSVSAHTTEWRCIAGKDEKKNVSNKH